MFNPITDQLDNYALKIEMNFAAHNCQISQQVTLFQDEEAVYEYVTEDQYADIVNARLQDEWVVGDIKGSGYDDTGTQQ